MSMLLASRSTLRLRGRDSFDLVQGLITNDINHLRSKKSIFTAFLNNQGRILFDCVIHNDNNNDEDALILDVDKNAQKNSKNT